MKPAFLMSMLLVSPIGQTPPAQDPRLADELAALLATQVPQGPASVERAAPAVGFETAGGPLRYLGAAPGHHFPSGMQGEPAVVARAFLRRNASVFGVASPYVGYELVRMSVVGERRYVRFQQVYQGVPVFAAQANVQVGPENGIQSVIVDLLRDTADLDLGRIPVDPAVSEDLAPEATRLLYPEELRSGLGITCRGLRLFAPSVLGMPGPVRLVWELRVLSSDGITTAEDVLLDALHGELVMRFPLHEPALQRAIYDSDSTGLIPPVPRRIEGQGPVGITDVDDTYDFLGDVHTFFQDKHGRDGYDGAGSPLIATARWCQPNPPTPQDPLPPPTCPPPGLAFWEFSSHSMFIGAGYAKDDVVAHEFTHGFTQSESNLVYANGSGALNESFSDLWGESTDLSFAHGDDGPAVRWQIGEDMPGGYIRSMKDPPLKNQPDRFGSSLFQDFTLLPNDSNDQGGVHKNSGINNKLFYLLSDGDSFNGYTITGIGFVEVAKLYYEVNTNLLLSGADFRDLYFALKQAAVNLNWSSSRRLSLEHACLAVEIGGIHVWSTAGCANQNGTRRCVIFEGGPYRLFATGLAAASSGDTIIARDGNYHEFGTVINQDVHIVSLGGDATIGR